MILGCETGEEAKKLRETVQGKMGENYKVVESPHLKPKIKITNIDIEEMNLSDNELNTIKKQNNLHTVNMRIVKKIPLQPNLSKQILLSICRQILSKEILQI